MARKNKLEKPYFTKITPNDGSSYKSVLLGCNRNNLAVSYERRTLTPEIYNKNQALELYEAYSECLKNAPALSSKQKNTELIVFIQGANSHIAANMLAKMIAEDRESPLPYALRIICNDKADAEYKDKKSCKDLQLRISFYQTNYPKFRLDNPDSNVSYCLDDVRNYRKYEDRQGTLGQLETPSRIHRLFNLPSNRALLEFVSTSTNSAYHLEICHNALREQILNCARSYLKEREVIDFRLVVRGEYSPYIMSEAAKYCKELYNKLNEEHRIELYIYCNKDDYFENSCIEDTTTRTQECYLWNGSEDFANIHNANLSDLGFTTDSYILAAKPLLEAQREEYSERIIGQFDSKDISIKDPDSPILLRLAATFDELPKDQSYLVCLNAYKHTECLDRFIGELKTIAPSNINVKFRMPHSNKANDDIIATIEKQPTF